MLIGLGVCNAFGKVEYLPMEQSQPVDEVTKSNVLSVFGKVPLHFVANCGQLDRSVVYYAKSEGATVYCTEEGLVFGFAEGSISLKFSSERRVKPEAQGELKGKVNYFIGNDPALWQTDIPTFSEVVYQEVYPDIDLVYNGNQRRLKYTFYLQPGANPEQILMIYDGVEGVWIDEATGELVIQTPWGDMRDAVPVAYQEIEGVRQEVDVSFRLMGEKRVGFAIGDYDPNCILTLDPGYSTYLGGSDSDSGHGIALDSSGNVYVTGHTISTNFPTLSPYQGSNAGDYDAFVTSFNSEGSPTLVELSLLTATTSADGVTLRWRTEAEIDNAGFAIYRNEEKDGNYTKIAFVPAAEDSETSNDYQLTDKDVESGKTYFYYLEDIDLAGGKSKSEIIKIVVPPARPLLLIPTEFRLLQNYPNPFNPETWLPYELAADATVTIRIYNANGRLIRQLNLGVQKAHSYINKEKAAYWDGKDQTGKAVSSGLYFYTLKAGDLQATRRMVIVK